MTAGELLAPDANLTAPTDASRPGLGDLRRFFRSGARPSPRLCLGCVVAWCVIAFSFALAVVIWGPARPEHLRAQAQAAAQTRLQSAGLPWARLDINGNVGTLVGEAPDPDALLAARAAAPALLADLIGPFGVVHRLEDKARVSDCGTRLQAVLALPQVRFAPGSHALDPWGEPVLKELAALAERCRDWTLVIEASVDGSALEAATRRLAQRRAQAVAAALLLQGVPVERIESRVGARTDPQRRVSLQLEQQAPRPTP